MNKNMNKYIFFIINLLCSVPLALLAQWDGTSRFFLEVENTWSNPKKYAPVVVSLDKMQVPFPVRSAVVTDGGTEIPSQLDDLNGDLKADELAFVIDLPAKGRKKIAVTLSSSNPEKNYPAQVFAEMMLLGDKVHTPIRSVTLPGNVDFYNKLLHHGPAFESELVGYRIYFDHKQTIDPYGKFHKGLEIEESQFYPTDEQLARGFGDDVLMVGSSCGVGALKGWNGTQATHIEPVAFRTESILAYGPIRTVVDVKVQDWKYQGRNLNMTQRYILYAGHRDLRIEIFFNEPLAQETFCTGVQNIMGGKTLSYSDHEGLVGCWGTYWPVSDTVKYAKETVGIATYVPQKYICKEVRDKDNFLYTLSVSGESHFYYYTMFTSTKETFGYSTPDAWFTYMENWKESLLHPLKVEVIKMTDR